MLLAILLCCATLNGLTQERNATVKQCVGINQPVGEAKGICPGRVVWSHAPGAAQWDGHDDAWKTIFPVRNRVFLSDSYVFAFRYIYLQIVDIILLIARMLSNKCYGSEEI